MTQRRTSFTGRRRARKTRWTVRLADRLSRWIITIGGLGAIVAVSTVALFLLWVVLPLFKSPRLDQARHAEAPTLAGAEATPFHVAVDEYGLMGWALGRDGALRVFRLSDGSLLEERRPFEGSALTAADFPISADEAAFGFADGSVRTGSIGFRTTFLEPTDVPEEIRRIEPGQTAAFRRGMLQRTPENQYRLQEIAVEIGDPIGEATGQPVRLVAYGKAPRGPLVAAWRRDGALRLFVGARNALFGTVTYSPVEAPIDAADLARGDPAFLLMSGLADSVMAAWEDGSLLRIDVRDPRAARAVERLDLVQDPAARLTALRYLLGGSTLLSGDSLGVTRGWFRILDPGTSGHGGEIMVNAKVLPAGPAPVAAIASSMRSRLAAVGYQDGTVSIFQVTTAEQLTTTRTGNGPGGIRAVAFGPRDDLLTALTADGLWRWRFSAAYPEVTLRALFRPIWYERHDAPAYVWQSSAATDDFEPKLSLMPLIFGTAKATFYSMLIGLPLALLAAIYTSEFLDPKLKGRIKPTMELMASLPSVVLGFLAALVFAPVVERVAPELLTSFVSVPVMLLLGAHLWQMLPPRWALPLARWRLLLMLACVPLGAGLGWLLGPAVEKLLFAGDLRTWLDGRSGSPLGGWMLLTLPLSAVLMHLFVSAFVTPRVRQISAGWSRQRCAAFEIVKFAGALALTLLAALALAALLTLAGWDPRGGFLGTYVQRNAFVVGIVMGFAIIPIIYTLSEDALSSVPEHLRAASLGAGATRWQTASRIVIPTAMSGLFSAVMVGLGRAVGETMIVLMAAGNTPVLDWNVFNGFRTLSANIATELPEAVRNSAHYRTLFLAGLVLFAITFVVNTFAEIVRLRFRKRAYQL